MGGGQQNNNELLTPSEGFRASWMLFGSAICGITGALFTLIVYATLPRARTRATIDVVYIAISGIICSSACVGATPAVVVGSARLVGCSSFDRPLFFVYIVAHPSNHRRG